MGVLAQGSLVQKFRPYPSAQRHLFLSSFSFSRLLRPLSPLPISPSLGRWRALRGVDDGDRCVGGRERARWWPTTRCRSLLRCDSRGSSAGVVAAARSAWLADLPRQRRRLREALGRPPPPLSIRHRDELIGCARRFLLLLSLLFLFLFHITISHGRWSGSTSGRCRGRKARRRA